MGGKARSGARRRTVGIIGAGMAGVSLAWLLDDSCDVVLLEARATVGGNIQSAEVDLDGHRFVVDMGAQYFHPTPYPTYTALLDTLDLYAPEPAESAAHRFPASITLSGAAEPTPRFVSPALPERWWPFFAPWNLEGIWAFGIAFISASVRERLNETWDLTVDDWLQTLPLSRKQWEGMVLPWVASLFSGSVEQARGMSARAAMVFAAKVLPPNPFDAIAYYVLEPGMTVALTRMLAQCTTVSLVTGTRVLGVSREAAGGFALHCTGGSTVHVDEVVFASSGPPTTELLAGLAGTWAQQTALRGIEFHHATLALHTDPVYAPADPAHRSFLNCQVEGGFCEASMWLATVAAAAPPATAARLWKSWVTHRARLPAQVLIESRFSHMLPTPATLRAQDRVAALQGIDHVWFAGGYLYPYDSQETALLSAMRVAAGLGVTSVRGARLGAVLNDPPDPMIWHLG